jgi:hypothetical protein
MLRHAAAPPDFQSQRAIGPRFGDPILASSVQLGGSLAGKDSFELSSTWSSEGLASETCRGFRCCRRPTRDFRRYREDRLGIITPVRRLPTGISPSTPG